MLSEMHGVDHSEVFNAIWEALLDQVSRLDQHILSYDA